MLLETLSNAAGVSGAEGPVRDIVLEAIRGEVDEIRADALGNLIALKRAADARSSAPRVMVAAHMDEVGVMIVHVETSGFLRFRPVGGIDPRVLLSKQVLIGEKAVPGVIGQKAVHLLKPSDRGHVVPVEQMFVDIGAKDRAEAESLVKLGDCGIFATRFASLGGTAKGKALDDRAGCAILAELLADEPYSCEIVGVFTVQEEVGLRGAQVAAYAVEPDFALVLEGTVCDDSPKKSDLSPTTRLGAGPAISIADRSAIADRRLVDLVVDTAKANGVPYQFKQPLVGGTDAGRIHLSRGGVPTVVLAVPCRYLHSPVSLLSMSDYENTLKLARATLARIDEVGK
jgi:putative aminopeptidase FrvX